MFTNMT